MEVYWNNIYPWIKGAWKVDEKLIGFQGKGSVVTYFRYPWHSWSRRPRSGLRPRAKRARERSEQHSSEVYSSRTGHLPEAPKCIGPEVNNFVTRQMRICAENQWNLRHPWIETYISSGITSSAEADMCRGSMEFKTPLNRSFQTCRHYKFSRCGYVQRVNGI